MATPFLKSSTLVLQYMRKSDRLFQVVNLIWVHQPITAEDLAGRIGVSVRTIYRYVDDLSVSGIPLYGVAGVGYALHEGFELPPLTLTQDELDALMLGVEMLSNSAGAELASSARTLLSKVAAVLLVGRLGRFDLQGSEGHGCTPPVLELESVQKMYQKEAGLQGTGMEPQRPKSPQLAGSRGVA